MSNEIKTRSLTPTEQKYTYAQSMQLEGQTGTIGHLRGDFATTGYGFYTTWFDTRPQWKSDEFKADLDTVINALREDKGLLHALISTLLIMTFGNAFLMLVADAVPHMANYAVFKYPVALVIGLIAAIFVICLSVPAIVYKATSDETVIERLHNFDS